MLRRFLLLISLVFAGHVHAGITGRVVAVTDGDTIKVLDRTNTEHKVRLTGIDAPERGQPFGAVSRDHLASMVAGSRCFFVGNTIMGGSTTQKMSWLNLTRSM